MAFLISSCRASYCMGSSQQSFTRMKPSIAKTNESAPSPAHSTEDPRRSGSVRNVRGFRASPASTCPHTQTRPRRHGMAQARSGQKPASNETGFSPPRRALVVQLVHLHATAERAVNDEVIREHQRQTDAGDAEHPGKRKLARGRGGDGNVLTRCRRAEQGDRITTPATTRFGNIMEAHRPTSITHAADVAMKTTRSEESLPFFMMATAKATITRAKKTMRSKDSSGAISA